MGNHGAIRFSFFVILSIAGLVIAILSALEGRIEWLASFCGFFGDGCVETTRFMLLGIPVWLWGIVFYTVLTGAVFFVRPAVFWIVMLGMGAELSLIWILVSMKLKCVFCLMNAVVVVLLFILCLEKKRAWQAMAISLLVFPVSNFLITKGDMANAQAGSAKPADSAVVAKVGDKTISTLALESPLASKIYELQQDIYLLKKKRLEELVIESLLEQEAEEKGMTMKELVDVTPPGRELVTDEDVELYFMKNRSKFTGWRGREEELRGRIREYLQGLKDRDQIKKITDPLRERYPVEIYLKEPPLPFSNVSVGESPVQGPVDAGVTVVEFSDYLCPVCRRSHEISQKIRQTYAGRIRWVFKDYPLKQHPGADKLAEAAHCAGEQEKFWEFQDQIFAASKKPEFEDLKGYARQLGLDIDRFTQCYESSKYHSHIEKDILTAWEAGVGSTPSFIINGKLKPGSMPFEEFIQIIDEELAKSETVSTRN
jgi:predicted DsbA family dithiol-disulfide isomerase